MTGGGTHLRIVVVDDDDIARESARRALRNAPCELEFIEAVDGIEALNLFRGDDRSAPLAPPFLVLLDLKMPRMNGLELLEVMSGDASLREIVVYVLTTSSRDDERVAAMDWGARGYIVKSELRERVPELFNAMRTLLDDADAAPSNPKPAPIAEPVA